MCPENVGNFVHLYMKTLNGRKLVMHPYLILMPKIYRQGFIFISLNLMFSSNSPAVSLLKVKKSLVSIWHAEYFRCQGETVLKVDFLLDVMRCRRVREPWFTAREDWLDDCGEFSLQLQRGGGITKTNNTQVYFRPRICTFT